MVQLGDFFPFKNQFVSGFHDHVERERAPKPPKPDFYWDPRGGQWVHRPTDKYAIADESLPSIGSIGFTALPHEIYEQITQQWGSLPAAKQPFVYWGGADHKWLLITAKTASSPSTDERTRARIEYEDALKYLKWLREQQPPLLTSEQYDKEVAELGERYRERI